MKKTRLLSKIRYIFKTLTKPVNTTFEINYGDGFVSVNRFEYLRHTLQELKKIEEAIL